MAVRQSGDETVSDQAHSVLPRRTIVRGGLAGLAAAVMTRTLPGCGPGGGNPVTDASLDSLGDALGDALLDTAVDADTVFPVRQLPAPIPLRSLIGNIGALGEADASGLRLPPGFTARIVAQARQMVPGTNHSWHDFPDGGATFATEDGGWIYVSNSEFPRTGGVGALRFAADGQLQSAYPILERTTLNCAGGKTPWHTWLSCEEVFNGRVFECDPWGQLPAVPRPQLGVFKHEAAAIDPSTGYAYLTEDETDGRLYRFVPARLEADGRPDLRSGRLEAAAVDLNGQVTWLEVPDPLVLNDVPTREQLPASTPFNGGEGIWYHDGVIHFSTKGDNRVRSYRVVDQQITVLYDAADHSPRPIIGVDNITVSCCGDVLVAEDGGLMRLVAILPDGRFVPLVQVVGQDSSEITGPAFDPSGTRLYFSSQRGDTWGITYEITGPFHEPI